MHKAFGPLSLWILQFLHELFCWRHKLRCGIFYLEVAFFLKSKTAQTERSASVLEYRETCFSKKFVSNRSRGYAKSCCLYLGYVLLVGLPCVASVNNEEASQRLKVPGWEDTQRGLIHSEGREMNKGLWKWVAQEEGIVRNVKWISKKDLVSLLLLQDAHRHCCFLIVPCTLITVPEPSELMRYSYSLELWPWWSGASWGQAHPHLSAREFANRLVKSVYLTSLHQSILHFHARTIWVCVCKDIE